MRMTITMLLAMGAMLIAAMPVAVVDPGVPTNLTVVREPAAQGDLLNVIGAWGAAQPGTYGIGHYRVRLLGRAPGQVDSAGADTLQWDATTTPTQLVDTFVVVRPPIGDTLAVWFGVQASEPSDTARPTLTSVFVWSAALVLRPVVVPPGPPGPVTVDTLHTALTFRMWPPGPYRIGSTAPPLLLRATYHAGSRLIACGNALLVPHGDLTLETVGVAACEDPLFPVDSVYDPRMGWRTPANLMAGMRFTVKDRPVPAATIMRGGSS